MFTFIETAVFSRLVYDYLPDEEYRRLQQSLVENPELGAVVRGSGGVRKLRWAQAGRGKRGGVRVIYYVRRPKGIIWMLTIYPKNVEDSIPGHVLKLIRDELDHD